MSKPYRAEITRFPERVRIRIEVPFMDKLVWIRPDFDNSKLTFEDPDSIPELGKMFNIYKMKDGFLSQVILTGFGQSVLMKYTEDNVNVGKWAYIKIDNDDGNITIDERNGD